MSINIRFICTTVAIGSAIALSSCSSTTVQESRQQGLENRQSRMDSRTSARQQRWETRAEREEARIDARFDSW
jgi:hypothetical protein